jgi:hypothetical protein
LQISLKHHFEVTHQLFEVGYFLSISSELFTQGIKLFFALCQPRDITQLTIVERFQLRLVVADSFFTGLLATSGC